MLNDNNQGKRPKKRYLVEVVEEKPKCLLVYHKVNRFVEVYEQKISQTHTVYQTSSLDENWSDFDLVVFFGVLPSLKELKTVKKVYFVFFNQKDEYLEAQKWLKRHHPSYKVINLGKSSRTIEELVETVIFKTPTPYYFNFSQKPIVKPIITNDPKKNLWLSLKIVLSVVVVLNLLFLFIFAGQSYLLLDLFKSQQASAQTLRHKILVLKQISNFSRGLSGVPKNTLFWLPGVETYLNIFRSVDKTSLLLVEGSDLLENFTQTTSLLTKKNKADFELAEIKLRVSKLKTQLKQLNNNFYQVLSSWQQTNIPFFNTKKQEFINQAQQAEEYLLVAEKIADKLPFLLGANQERQYLVLFMNNMELRPGGGFIGSLAVVRMHKYSLKEVAVYDVYTLDGQLKVHIDPPGPIAKYLDQPHFFLRDSNFSPDFTVNAKEALKFLKIESEWPDFDAVFGITLTTVQRLLTLFPEFYVADYNENVTADNFFIKAQSYAEKNFFPGSYGKKDFLQAVFQTLLLKLEQGDYDYWRLVSLVRDLFQEKFMVAYFQNSALQQTFDELFWTGRVVSTDCNFASGCFSDYVYVVDANLGINKANFFVQRTIRLNTVINSDLTVKNILALDYYNQSSPDIFPGGTYKNYVQLYLPKNTNINQLLIDGVNATEYDVATELGLRKVGLILEVDPGAKANITLEYNFLESLKKEQQYQLIVQKQIGSINNDLVWRVDIPAGLSLSQSNFTPIVRPNGFVYNTFLQQDRILIVDFK